MGKYLYEEIKDYLLEIIKENRNTPHYKLPSENQIALKFSTTRITAKKALSDLQEAGYIYRIHGKGSFIQPEVQTRKDINAGDFICMMLPNIESRFIAEMVEGAKAVLCAAGYHLVLINESEQQIRSNTLITHLTTLGIKGIIVFPNSRARYNKDLLMLAFNKFPVVFVDRTLHDFDVSSVTSDHFQVSQKAVQLLIDRGCKNIGFITLPAEFSSSIARRISGYEKAHVANDRKICANHFLYITKQSENLTDTITQFLSSHPEIDGLLSYGGDIGFSVYRSIRSLGIQVPQQLKVVFFDDEYSNFADVLPFAPTCVAQRSFEIGRKAAELIADYIASKSIRIDKILIDCDIIERQSTKGDTL